ncbi:DNA-3-methyladenine glycosylase [Rhodococcus sp. PvR044]|jgi:DNA-3-methyladenine glycosylase|uniref:DNA-3-methyladenine glycosylase n=1 Tax=Rhodococcus TaxID=1827 RepID=UPI000BD63CD3|nr:MULTISPECIES: DNA-3-methyladenine glycosylase [Rhodococcus]MBP1159028.1 DNA-3-methyladenine glycosylase [Rhodococcus sp. PvR099]MCZ4558493.1 DNA-3-methyladenine glycosylase [Rhodococcus maanshanensis]PTR39099.1 DNA-3-methyladenine glycosylase [Rhodococcus sp. OK611]SNX92885.1 DNA-3-methyladenine glycosylase [Rhodococcus sp. OK270]
MSERELAAADPLTAARLVLGARLSAGGVTVRVVEVEAYGSDPAGPWPDPAAHSYPGPTPRNAVMFGPAGRLYVYLSHGLHLCMNVSCAGVGTAGAVLLRAAEVIDGEDIVRRRRGPDKRHRDLARGPGNLGQALGITLADNGTDLFAGGSTLRLRLDPLLDHEEGPRVGVSRAAEWPWRLWDPTSSAVSAYRRSPRASVVPGAGESRT